jgi:uncharacterized membrane protein
MNNTLDELTKSLATRRGALRKLCVGFAGIALACLGLANNAEADPTFTQIDYPGESGTLALDINAGGEMVGRYIDSAGLHRGFLLSAGVFTPIDVPGSVYSPPLGINASGDIVGEYSLSDADGVKDIKGFLLHNGIYSTIEFPGAAQTRAIGINQGGDIVGYYTTQLQGKHHGFVFSGGVYTSLDFPNSDYTDLWKINDRGQMAGRYRTSGSEKFHLFLLSGGTFLPVPDYAEASQMAPTVPASHHSGLNGNCDLVTSYSDSKPVQNNNLNVNMILSLHGLLWSRGSYIPIDFPGATGTLAFGINDSGAIVGCYLDPATGIHGFVRTP